MPTLSFRSIIALALIGLVVFVAPWLVTVYTDWLWFREVGYEQVFVRTLTARAMLGGVVFLVAFAVLYAERAARPESPQAAFSSRSSTPRGRARSRSI